jgi:hypothetical protein
VFAKLRPGTVLLRIANVNPANVKQHSDRVVYRAIGMFLIVYCGYATVGGVQFVNAFTNYADPWWRWLVGPLVAAAVVTYDRAVVGQVSVNLDDPAAKDPGTLLRRRRWSLYAVRSLIAVLVAFAVTEPIMLGLYRGEIDARLAARHSAELDRANTSGAAGDYRSQLANLTRQNAADDDAVTTLMEQATRLRQQAAADYDRADAESKGKGVTGRPGCPAGGECARLKAQSAQLNAQADSFGQQATKLRVDQAAARRARDTAAADLERKIAEQTDLNGTAVRGDAGFGARTAAMLALVRSDPWGIGRTYVMFALLLILLDCAAVALKFVTYGNGYERAEAADARRAEQQRIERTDAENDLARKAATKYYAAAEDVMLAAIHSQTQDAEFRRRVERQAQEHLSQILHHAHP